MMQQTEIDLTDTAQLQIGKGQMESELLPLKKLPEIMDKSDNGQSHDVRTITSMVDEYLGTYTADMRCKTIAGDSSL